MCSELYNAVLESWRGTYAWWRERHPGAEKFPAERSQSHYDRMKMFTSVRCAEGKKPGYPRFKPRHRWRTIEIPDAFASMIVPPNTSKNGSATSTIASLPSWVRERRCLSCGWCARRCGRKYMLW